MESISGIERNEMEAKKKALSFLFLRVVEFIGEKKNLTRCETKAAGVDVSFDRHQ